LIFLKNQDSVGRNKKWTYSKGRLVVVLFCGWGSRAKRPEPVLLAGTSGRGRSSKNGLKTLSHITQDSSLFSFVAPELQIIFRESNC
jgi:hypothetical protein